MARGAKQSGAGIRWKGDDFARYAEDLRDLQNRMLDDLERDLNGLGEQAVMELREKIRASGTETNPHGRYETWDMHDSTTYDVKREGDRLLLRYGWLNAHIPYVVMQDRGTRALKEKQNVDPFNKPGPGIPGMFALLHTHIEVRNLARDMGFG